MRVACLIVVAALLCAACSSDDARPLDAQKPDRVVFNPEPQHGPYVVVVVDNHFHDIHPVDDPSIAAKRTFVVTNEGRNTHNFSVTGTKISVDLKPGDTLRWHRIGNVLEPGTYDVFCRFHSGMTGKFTVVRKASS
ncbi:MAG: cupredoxin domain-containing protein [Actinomycetota bacterium]